MPLLREKKSISGSKGGKRMAVVDVVLSLHRDPVPYR